MADRWSPDGSGEEGAPPEHDVRRTAEAGPEGLPLRLVLVGFMAAGKTSTGRALARRTGYRFVDLDAEVERRAGRTIPEIFREQGEATFRRLEAEVTAALDAAGGASGATARDGVGADAAARAADEAGQRDPGNGPGDEGGLVVATGGGWMARPELRDRWTGAVRIWLRVSAEEALRRLEGDLATRPMVDPETPLASLRDLLERRRDAYARAEHAVRTDGRTPEQVAGRVLRSLRGD